MIEAEIPTDKDAAQSTEQDARTLQELEKC